MKIEQADETGTPRRQGAAGAMPRHVAVIMDGNGRWATRRGLPRAVGHREGAKAVRRVVESARRRGIATLTLFAFSAENWRRPAAEVAALMSLFETFLVREARRCAENDILLRVIGRRNRLGAPLVRAIDAAEALTAGGTAMDLRIAVDYSGRDAILSAVALLPHGLPPTRQDLLAALGRARCGGAPDVDLLVRTGGEHRISDFLLWESAYAEVYFSDRLWPDVADSDLAEALSWFSGRQRRFGGLPSIPARSARSSGDSREEPVHAA